MNKKKIISMFLTVVLIIASGYTVVGAKENNNNIICNEETGGVENLDKLEKLNPNKIRSYSGRAVIDEVAAFDKDKERIFAHSAVQYNLQKYMSIPANQESVEKRSIELHGGITSNNCVYFASESLRRAGVDIPTNVAYTTNLEKALVDRGWVKNTNLNDLQPGDVVLCSNVHSYIFMQWADDGTAYVVDNQKAYFGSPLHLRKVFIVGEGETSISTHFYRYAGKDISSTLGNDTYVASGEPNYPVNAKVTQNKSFSVMDSDKKVLQGRAVEYGDDISVVEIYPSRSLAEIMYKSYIGWIHCYVDISIMDSIKLNYLDKWNGDSTPSNVYLDSSASSYMTSLPAYGKATPLHFTNGKQHVAFKNNGKWQSGYVTYNGGFGGRPQNKVLGEDAFILASKSKYPINATVKSSTKFNLKDKNGKVVDGRYITNNDNISIIEIYPSKNLVEVIYSVPEGEAHGYADISIMNFVDLKYKDKWVGDGTASNVYYDSGLSSYMTSLPAYGKATPLHKVEGSLHVAFLYNGKWQSGYVRYEGGFSGF